MTHSVETKMKFIPVVKARVVASSTFENADVLYDFIDTDDEMSYDV